MNAEIVAADARDQNRSSTNLTNLHESNSSILFVPIREIRGHILFKPRQRFSLNQIKRFQPDIKMRIAIHQNQLAVIGRGVVEALTVGPGDELIAAAVDQEYRGARLRDGAQRIRVIGIEAGQASGGI